MLSESIRDALRFYFITDDGAPGLSAFQQAEIAVRAGAGLIQYRNKQLAAGLYPEAKAIRDLCRCNGVPFVVNDHILLAKAVGADGVHVGQEDEAARTARSVLGDAAIVGVSVSTLGELAGTDLSVCDYIGTGPVFSTQTKKDAKAVIGLEGLSAVCRKTALPVVAIGGIGATNAADCLRHGAAGVAVISCISRSAHPSESALALGKVCGRPPREMLFSPWNDEFGLIDRLIRAASETTGRPAAGIRVLPGDDACLLDAISDPVVTTDAHKEGVHFRLDWQTPEQVGHKAVTITLSDLAACYARPVGLFVNLALPSNFSEAFVESLHSGILKALAAYGGALGGGNISRASELSVDLFAIGRGRPGLFPTRSAARPGDDLYSTGPLGLARAGLFCLNRKESRFDSLIGKFKIPAARFDAAEVLAGHAVRCVMDISDGLCGDARHIARASHLTVEFDLDPEDFDPVLVEFCERYTLSPTEMVLSGGEDYELLFACPPETFRAIQRALPGAVRVGRCLPYTGRYLENVPPGAASFQHGKA